jgi:MFS family permease
MPNNRPRVPIGLPIAVVIFLVLGLLAGPFIAARATPEQLADNVLLNAIPFILIFISIILAFITLIVFVAGLLDHRISKRAHQLVETILIIGIVLGVFGMFQPWLFAAYRYGFMLLLISTLGFILWTHITPREAAVRQQAESATVDDIVRLDARAETGE